MKKVLYIIAAVFIFVSCEKDVDIDLPQPDAKLVVEGYIENDAFPIVVLTRNSSYFDPVDSTTLANLFVTNATVVIYDGFEYDTLQPVIDINNINNSVWPFIYYKGSKFKGTENGQYWLTITAEGQTITGFTTIPAKHSFDSLWWKAEPVSDSLGYIWARFTDDPIEKNYYRIFTHRLGRDFADVPLFGSTYDDIFFAGQSIDFSMFRGMNSLTNDSAYSDEEFGLFRKGDSVVVRLSCMDREHYDFWRTVEQESFSGGNPFANPVTIRHNVEGAIGVFGGYGSVYDTIVIQ